MLDRKTIHPHIETIHSHIDRISRPNKVIHIYTVKHMRPQHHGLQIAHQTTIIDVNPNLTNLCPLGKNKPIIMYVNPSPIKSNLDRPIQPKQQQTNLDPSPPRGGETVQI